MRTANCWAGPRNADRIDVLHLHVSLTQASCVIVSGFTYPLRNFVHGALNGLNLASAHYAYWLFSLFSRHISRTQSFQQYRHIIYLALVALKLLVSLISRLVACSPRMVVATHTDRHTHRHTERVTTTVTLAAHARRGLISVCYAI